jgi:hypothetical protein
MNSFRKLLVAFTLLALVMGWASAPANAQISPVRLKVTKTPKKERDADTKAMRSSVLYTVELSNASTKPTDDLTIKWTILYKPRNYSSMLSLMGGDRTCSLGLGQKFVFETDAVEIDSVQGSYGHSTYRNRAEIVACLIEVCAGKKILVSDAQPPDAKETIKKYKDAEEKRLKAMQPAAANR